MRYTRATARTSSLFCALALAFTLTGAPAADATAVAPGGYVALGDSYSSGVGAGGYDGASGDCLRSTVAYPRLWASAHSPSSFDFTACSGARTDDVVAGQLGPLGPGTGLVSITVGGNDAGFADVMTTCVLQPESSCLARLDEADAYIGSTLPGRLDEVYAAIAARAPAAHVVVLGYPRLYRLGGDCASELSETERTAINKAADRLNGVTAERAAGHGFTFGDVTTAFTGHEICSGNEWLHSVDWLDAGQSYHPTARGQSGGYLPVLTSAV
ncbi:lipase 1 [Streptomyces sulfonofaciens]|uniref:triacylglycerol lipase n=1 Tax=Streptomyces sulfonofaciens TaxID=68272 RepID=A0A919KWE8_9ACTN|nr:SGNH/GDSL hydrolase family protein [Streptomyces sulfonofaciens]GHH75042.1 lipase 1 [Streptomyces sulfonofaciens]